MIGVSLAMPPPPEVSVVIPVRNEEETVAELAQRLRDTLPQAHEILFVDDGSGDGTWQRLVRIHEPGRVRLVKLRAPSGKSAALMAGFARSRGSIVFTLDGDLQDDPAEIPAFLGKLEEGYDLVTGWKKTRHDPFHKVAASRLFNFLMRRLTGIPLHDMNCGFKCFRGELARSLRLYGDQHRFIPVFALHQGYRVGEIEVRHHPRRHGRSKYGFSRLFKGVLDLGTVLLRTRFHGRPAHASGLVACAFLLGAAVLLALAALRVLHPSLAVLALALGVVLGVGMLVFLAAGWLAEIWLDNAPPEASVFSASVEEARD